MDERIPVKRLTVNVGMNPQGQTFGANHIAHGLKRLWVIPGKLGIVETLDPDGSIKNISEVPLPPFGWEYEPLGETVQ